MDINTEISVCNITLGACGPPPAEHCPKKFDGGSFIGGFFLMVGLVLVSGVGFVFYRKKKGSGAYEPLKG